MKTKWMVLVLSAGVVACTSSGYDDQPRSRPMPRAASSSNAIDFIPFDDWWHQPAVASAVNLTNDQLTALDRLAADDRDQIQRLERDSMTATRGLHDVLDSRQPSIADIDSAARRAREIHDALFDRQMHMLAAERQVLSDDQWRTLQQQLQRERSDRRGEEGGRRRGGRGGMGGRGRRPGF